MEKENILCLIKETMKALYNAYRKEDGAIDIVRKLDHISITWEIKR